MDRKTFIGVLQENQGVVVVKYGAMWCKPCKVIEPYLQEYRRRLPSNVVYHELDVDDDFDLYAHLKTKKQVHGVPVLLAYKKGNVTPFADHCVTGTNHGDIDHFFREVCGSAKINSE
jgi:thiol-disulfide isomerase/thioredoxin